MPQKTSAFRPEQKALGVRRQRAKLVRTRYEGYPNLMERRRDRVVIRKTIGVSLGAKVNERREIKRANRRTCKIRGAGGETAQQEARQNTAPGRIPNDESIPKQGF